MLSLLLARHTYHWQRLLKVLNIFCNGDNKNVLLQLAGSTIKMIRNLPLPLVRSSLMVAAKATDSTLFLLKGVSEYTIDVQTYVLFYFFCLCI